MPLAPLQYPPPANWQDFETLCLILWRDIWGDPDAQLNGRTGQAQQGVDVFGRPNLGAVWAGVQCKLKEQHGGDALGEAELRAEVEKARSFKPQLSQFILATTAQRDARIQEVARHLREEKFSVDVWSWDDIRAALHQRPHLIPKVYGQSERRRFPPSRLPLTGEFFVGRAKELRALTKAWKDTRTNIVQIVAMGGVGKTHLVKKWREKLTTSGRTDAESVYDWSFYTQGSAQQASADDFFDRTLRAFGETATQNFRDPWEKGARLAKLVKERRTLFILDGLEPLQHPPGPSRGKLSDLSIQALLRGLAEENPGLCIITTRYPVADLAEIGEPTRITIDLNTLSADDGIQLLRQHGIRGSDEVLRKATREYDGHALSLILLGTYVRDRFQGNIERRIEGTILHGDERHAHHAQRMIESYVDWFESEPGADDVSRAAVAILRLLGLFNRPADANCLNALRAWPPIVSLTESLWVGDDQEELWRKAVTRLRGARLIADESPDLDSGLDCHPLVREYFETRLAGSRAKAASEAHRRLFEHLKQSAPDYPDTLAAMLPLYHAIRHGCAAGLYNDAYEIHLKRIRRSRKENYAIKVLGAISADLAALACFFEHRWKRPSAQVGQERQMILLNNVGFRLRALGQLRDSIVPFRAALKMGIEQKNWPEATTCAINLSEVQLLLGKMCEAVQSAEQSIELAGRSGDPMDQSLTRAVLGHALHHVGFWAEALRAFIEAEEIQQAERPGKLLQSVQGQKYCELLLDRASSEDADVNHDADLTVPEVLSANMELAIQTFREIRARATCILKDDQSHSLLSRALIQLTLGRTYMAELEAMEALPDNKVWDATGSALPPKSTLLHMSAAHVKNCVSLLRKGGWQSELPRGLIASANILRIKREYQAAREQLLEAAAIAKRGDMLVWQIDVAIELGRIALAMNNLSEAVQLMDEARKLIKQTEDFYTPHCPSLGGVAQPGYCISGETRSIIGYRRRARSLGELEHSIADRQRS